MLDLLSFQSCRCVSLSFIDNLTRGGHDFCNGSGGTASMELVAYQGKTFSDCCCFTHTRYKEWWSPGRDCMWIINWTRRALLPGLSCDWVSGTASVELVAYQGKTCSDGCCFTPTRQRVVEPWRGPHLLPSLIDTMLDLVPFQPCRCVSLSSWIIGLVKAVAFARTQL